MKKQIGVLLLIVLLVSATISCKSENQVKEINISYVREPFNLPLTIMKEKQIAEKVFGEKGIKVNYYEISSGAKQCEAIAAGSLDIASVINTASVILANQGGNPVEIFAGFAKPEKMFVLLTSNDGIRSVKDLKGKKVAGPKGSVLHELLVAALKKEGMSVSDVEFINMGIPTGISAMSALRVDAALAAGPAVINAQKNGGRIVFTCEGYVEPLLVSACSKKFASEHPELVALFNDALNQARKWMDANREEAIRIGADAAGIQLEDAKTLYSWSNFITHLDKKDMDAIGHDIDFMLSTGMISGQIDKMSFVSKAAIR